MTPGLSGGKTAAGAGAITGIGSIIGAGFFVREMVGGGFFGMELIMPSLRLEIKSEGLVGCSVMPSSRGMYRSRPPPLAGPLTPAATIMSKVRNGWSTNSKPRSSATGNSWMSNGPGSNARPPCNADWLVLPRWAKLAAFKTPLFAFAF
jgi:hypothetical protein